MLRVKRNCVLVLSESNTTNLKATSQAQAEVFTTLQCRAVDIISDTDLDCSLHESSNLRRYLIPPGESSSRYQTISSSELLVSQRDEDEDLTQYRPEKRRRIAIVLILLCHLCIWTVGNAPVVWFPRIVKER